MITFNQPLNWPAEIPLNWDPRPSRFGDHTMSQAVEFVQAELARLLRKVANDHPFGRRMSADYYAAKINETMREALRAGVRPADLITAMECDAFDKEAESE